MRLTVITQTSSVGKDDIFFNNLNLSSCGIPAGVWALQWNEYGDNLGHIEFEAPIPNEQITSIPQWGNNCLAVWQVAYDESINPPPPPPHTAEQNKQVAVMRLQETDWTTIPDVGDPTKSNPYLGNVQDFVTYRNAVRQYAINPIAGNINWPTIPQENWITV